MRRQAGADDLRLDTRDAWAHYVLDDPQPIDWDDIRQAAIDAAYEIVTLELELRGEVVDESGAQWFQVQETGQKLELAGGLPTGWSGRLIMHVSDWDGIAPLAHPQERSAAPNVPWTTAPQGGVPAQLPEPAPE